MSKRAIFDKKNILVTGGAGFIGSHLCDELIKNNKVICVDDFSTGDERNIDHFLADPNFEFIRHNISEPLDIEKLPELQKFRIEFQGVQEIYNLACPTSPANFNKNIIATIDALSVGMRNVLNLAKKYDAKLMHFSSSVVYGPRSDSREVVKESDSGQVDFMSERSSYDEGKRFAEMMVDNYRKAFNLNTKIIRLFRVYGPRMKLNDGQMIPDFVNNALDDKEIIIPGDENFSSSFCYVSDVIDASLKIMESDLSGPFNIGSDIKIKVSDIAQEIIKKIGSSSQVSFGEKHFFITPLCLPNISKARDELGWMPVVTLDKGLEKTIDDLRASKGLLGVNSLI